METLESCFRHGNPGQRQLAIARTADRAQNRLTRPRDVEAFLDGLQRQALVEPSLPVRVPLERVLAEIAAGR